MHAQPPACLESTQSVHRVLKALKNVLRVTLSLYKLSLTLIIKKLKMPKSTQFGPENTVVGKQCTFPVLIYLETKRNKEYILSG